MTVAKRFGKIHRPGTARPPSRFPCPDFQPRSSPLPGGRTGPCSADPLPAGAERVVDYAIDVRLDAHQKTLAGTEHVTWTNPSGDEVPQSLVPPVPERVPQRPYRRSSANQAASCAATRCRRMAGAGPTHVDAPRRRPGPARTARFERPDDGNADDFTVLRVALPSPGPPRGSVSSTSRGRRSCRRSSRGPATRRDYYLIGQWDPKIAVYGTARRARAHGRRLELPPVPRALRVLRGLRSLTVAFTVPGRSPSGRPAIASRRPPARVERCVTYEQDDVHDFAWTADSASWSTARGSRAPVTSPRPISAQQRHRTRTDGSTRCG